MEGDGAWVAGEVLVGVVSPSRRGTFLWFLLPCGRGISPSGEVWGACAACVFASPARGKGGLLGAAPLLDPLCTPPGTPPKKDFQLPWNGEGTRLVLRELPSLATLAQVISLRDA